MAQGYDTEEQKERVLLVGVQLDNQEDMESSLEELKALAKTAGAETVGRRWRAAWCRCGRPFIRERTSEKEN